MSAHKMNRRDFLKMAAVTSAGAVIAGCTPQAAVTPAAVADPSKLEGTLSIWMSDWGKEWNDPMIKLSDLYTAEVAPNVTVEWTFLPNVTEKLVSAISAGEPPDSALIDEGYGVPKMAAAGGLINLRSFYDVAGMKKEDFIPFTWATVLHKNEPYGVPGGAGAVLLMINHDVWNDAGLDPTAIPEVPTWAQFVDYGQKMTKKDDSGKVTRIGANPLSWHQFIGINGLKHYTSDLTKIAVNSPESVAAMTQWLETTPQGIAYDEIDTMLSGAPTTPYGSWAAGMQGIVWDGFWLFMAIDKYYPDLKYTLNKLPTPNGTKDETKQYTGWVWDMSIPKGAKMTDAAWSFIKFGFYDKAEYLADTLNWTSRLSAFPEFEKRTQAIMGEDNRMAPYLHTFSEIQVDAGYFVPYTPIFQKLGDQLNQAVESVVRGQKELQAAMDEVYNTLQPELDAAQGTF